EHVRVLGFVPDLSGLLHRLRATAAPLRYGAGLKGKVLESLAHGIPCVMTECAAEGMELPTSLEWLIAETSKEFAVKLTQVHEDRALNERLGAAGVEVIPHRHSSAPTRPLLREAAPRRAG